jgi:methylenetetrahydrofolate dehydrogenase (NADP+)/methenyltetrahydrofolate cyclohydrolase
MNQLASQNIKTDIIDGKAFAQQLRKDIAAQAELFEQQYNTKPGLAVVLVGNDAASQVYVRMKMKQAAEAGIVSFKHILEANICEAELLTLIDTLNKDDSVDGILVQLPLPKHINESAVLQAILPSKDVDGFHPYNVGQLCIGEPTLVPCTPSGCLMLLQDRLGDLSGLKAVVVGRSNIVGKPMASLLLNANCTVTTVHSRSLNLANECRQADILVVATGRPLMIGAEHIKPGAIILDVGINRITDVDGQARLVGDVDIDAACDVAGAVTPVPGGIGPMTVACLLRNTLIAAQHRKKRSD